MSSQFKFTYPKISLSTPYHFDETNGFLFAAKRSVAVRLWPDPQILPCPKDTEPLDIGQLPTSELEKRLAGLVDEIELRKRLLVSNQPNRVPQYATQLERLRGLENSLALVKWYDNVPIEIRRLVSIYRTRHFCCLRALYELGDEFDGSTCNIHRGLELLEQHPVLFWLLAVTPSPGVEQFSHLKDIKLRDMLPVVGLPATKSWLKTLKKIDPSALNENTRKILLDAAKNSRQEQFLRNCSRINMNLLAISADAVLCKLISTEMRKSLEKVDCVDDQIFSELRELFDLAVILIGTPSTQHFLLGLKSTDEISEALLEAKSELPAGTSSIEPPLPPLPGMRPLLDADAVLEEGSLMSNCLKDLFNWHQVVGGIYALYAMEEPERVTVGLIKFDGRWHLDQIELEDSEAPLASTIAVVEAWVAKNQHPGAIYKQLCLELD